MKQYTRKTKNTAILIFALTILIGSTMKLWDLLAGRSVTTSIWEVVGILVPAIVIAIISQYKTVD